MTKTTDRVQALLDPHRRHAVRLLQPGAQLRLPLVVLLITFVIAVLFAAHSYYAFARLYEMTMSVVPGAFAQLIREQTVGFLIVSATLSCVYIAAIVGFALAYTHQLVGPTVAFRRHIAALRRGDYSARVALRSHDTVFRDVATQLNELAEQLQRGNAVRR